jgi:hypothetical protein
MKDFCCESEYSNNPSNMHDIEEYIISSSVISEPICEKRRILDVGFGEGKF